MSGWEPGEPVTVVEHGPDRRPRPGGQRHQATVAAAEGIYVQVIYADPALRPAPSGRDLFYAESGWRAWDGEMRWKLERP